MSFWWHWFSKNSKTLATSPLQPQGPIILHSQSLMTLKIKINLKIWMLGSFLQSKRISPIFESPHWSWPVMKFTWPDLTFLKNVWLTSCDAGRSAGGSVSQAHAQIGSPSCFVLFAVKLTLLLLLSGSLMSKSSHGENVKALVTTVTVTRRWLQPRPMLNNIIWRISRPWLNMKSVIVSSGCHGVATRDSRRKFG